MSKNRRARVKQQARRKRLSGRLVAAGMALALAGAAFALRGPGTISTRHTAATMPLQSQSGFSPQSPAKEYIYAGGRLVATEEPSGTNLPVAPTATGAADGRLYWIDNSDNESGFKIEKESPECGSTWTQIGTAAAGATSYPLLYPCCGSRFRVRAWNAAGDSAYSDVVTYKGTCSLYYDSRVEDAVADFSPTQNPSGSWSYGYRSAAGGTFALLSSNNNVYGLPSGMHTWYLPGAYNLPAVIHNGTGVTQSYFGATQPTALLNLYPGAGGERSVVRWTAQTAGTVSVSGRFEGLDATTTSVSVVKNGSATLFAGNVNGLGSQAPFSLSSLTVAAGDTIEFQVSYNGDIQHDSTGLATTVSVQGQPPPLTFNAVSDFSPTQNQGAVWAYGYRAAGGGAFSALTNNDNLYGLPSGMHTWYLPNAFNLPAVIHNGTGAAQSYFGATQPTDLLNLYPGAAGEKAVVRWTAPRAGTAQVAGRFQGLDATTTAVSVVKNGSTTLASGNVNGMGNQANFSLTVAVAAGDTVEFNVYYNGDVQHDSTGLAASITLQ